MTTRLRIGVIADDFTGASDIANTLSVAGAKTVLLPGIPAGALPQGFDAAVIALKSRSVAASMAVAQSLAACRALRAAGAVQIVFKYCSTFDSTPDGNIGPVAAALLTELGVGSTLVCPAFPANGRTVYQGHLFVGDRLLNQSGMENHPITPMTDPDLRRWLGRQTTLTVGHLPLSVVRFGELAIEFRQLTDVGTRLIVADAIADTDLYALSALADGHALVTGGSGIAMGLPLNFGIRPAAVAPEFDGESGPGLVLSGSCSRATLGQVARYRLDHPSLRLDDTVLTDPVQVRVSAIDFIDRHRHDKPLIYSSTDPAEVSAQQARHGAERIALAYEALFAEIAILAVERGYTRIVVAGGETSSAVAGALGSAPFLIGPEIAKGVPALRMLGGPPLVMALKSGNFGDENFMARAMTILEGGE